MEIIERVKNFFNFGRSNLDEESEIRPLEIDYKASMSETDFPDLDEFDFIDYDSFSKFRQLSDDRRVQYDAYD